MKQLTNHIARGRWAACLLGTVALAWALPVSAASNCSQRLDFDEVYPCEFRSQATNLISAGTVLFEKLSGTTFTATLELDGATNLGYCTCKTKPQNPPGFNKSKSFECVSALAGGAVETMEGAVIGNGDVISQGQIWSVNEALPSFLRMAFTCDKRAGNDDDSDAGDEDDSDDGDASALTVKAQPSSWNTNWLQKDGGTVSVLFDGDGLDDIAANTIALIGSDPAATPLAPLTVRRRGNRLDAQFGRGDAIRTLLAPKKGETHAVTVEFEVGGAAARLAFDVRVTGK